MALHAVEAQLRELLTWPENWNGYDCLPPTPANVQRAIVWAHTVGIPVTGGRFDIVTSGCWGEVTFEWWHGQKKLALGVDTVGVSGLCFNTALSPRHPCTFIECVCNTVEALQDVWDWLLDPEQIALTGPARDEGDA